LTKACIFNREERQRLKEFALARVAKEIVVMQSSNQRKQKKVYFQTFLSITHIFLTKFIVISGGSESI
jgi:hypothetical protein